MQLKHCIETDQSDEGVYLIGCSCPHLYLSMRWLVVFWLFIAAVLAAEAIPYFKHIEFSHKFMKKHKTFAKKQFRLLSKKAKDEGKKFDRPEVAKDILKGFEQIRKITALDKNLQAQAWAQKPKLLQLKNDLKSMEKIMKLDRKMRRKAIRKNKRVAAKIALFSLVHPFNENSPLNEKSQRRPNKTVTPNTNHPHRTFTQEDGSLRLMFSTVIAPGKNLPDTRQLAFTDRKGRKCRCLC